MEKEEEEESIHLVLCVVVKCTRTRRERERERDRAKGAECRTTSISLCCFLFILSFFGSFLFSRLLVELPLLLNCTALDTRSRQPCYERY